MASYSGRIGLNDLSPELRALIENLIANGGGGGNNGCNCNGDCCNGSGGSTDTDSGSNVVIGETKPENLSAGSFWVETAGFTPPKSKGVNFVLSEEQPENLEDGDVWVQVVDKGLGTTFFVMSNAIFGKNEPEKTNIWLDPQNL